MIIEEEYYIPKIEQFVEGFEYQTKHTMGYSIIDFSNPEKSTKPKMEDYWFDNVVPNLDPITYPYTFKTEGGDTVTIMNDDGLSSDPLKTIKILLENGNIRAKK